MTGSPIARGPRPSSLYDVLELILDKGLVIDAYVRVSLVGIELLTIDARIVVASVDTYLRFAEAANRLDLQSTGDSKGLPELMGDLTENGASRKTKGALSGAKETISDLLGGGDDGEQEQEERRERVGARRSSGEGERRRRATRARRDDGSGSSGSSGSSGGSPDDRDEDDR